ncbi:MAG: tRNA uridine-5-carboxymethylaminomethyl(34) synthesis GTPase MnmE [Saprospiraceae bacterium]|nr:tRNA uridine-5-carboxymethylaminomethyl(34) synthesis GTPase MnmE [Saprospiraceae bacterium]
MNIRNSTIVALATPAGTGALGIIRLSGPETFPLVDDIFIGADLLTAKSHSIHYGHLVDTSGDTIDEVLVFLFRGPHSYTGEDVIEISGHGSPYILQKIIERCLEKGAVMAQPGEFTLRAFLHGKLDLSQAEAVSDLIASQSAASHKMAIDQMRGGYSEKIQELRQQLIHFAGMLELELDFAEEDVEFADRTELIELVKNTQKTIQELISSFRLGNAMKNGVVTVIAGRPNAGKSTLLNRLLKEERAIVSDIAGTTRDTVEEILNIKGIDYRLIDTAGIREAQDQIEEIGVKKTMEKISQASLLLYVFDVARITAAEVTEDLKKLKHENLQLVVVANKMDLYPYAKAEEFLSPYLKQEQFIPVSAKNDMNIEYLKDHLYQLITGSTENRESVIVTNTRHIDALQKTDQALQSVLNGFQSQITSDFIAMDMRQAIYHLGEITGEISTDDLLEHIFRNFCIGK